MTTPVDLDRQPRWPARLGELVRLLAASNTTSSRDAVRAEAWSLLHSGLLRFLHHHVHKLGSLSEDDLEDVAAEKALDLLGRAESGQWNVDGRGPSEIAGYLSRVARNGLVDCFRDRGRFVKIDAPDHPVLEQHPAFMAKGTSRPDHVAESKQFARHLRDCIEALAERSRRIWFLRAFHDLSSNDIADHPSVRLKASHVDVLLQRARDSMRRCVEKQGHDVRDTPPGTFVELWRYFKRLEIS